MAQAINMMHSDTAAVEDKDFPKCGYLHLTTANAVQHGGTHYKDKRIQPWDFIHANGLGFFEGNAIKYLSRWKEKGGVSDLKKAIHYIEKLIEIEELGLDKT